MKSCAVSKLCKEILPLATLVTPNLSEAEILSDCVISNSEERKYAAKKISTLYGCTLSSAIASNLAKGFSVEEAVRRAKEYVSGALAAMLDLGSGSGPMQHNFNLEGYFTEGSSDQ